MPKTPIKNLKDFRKTLFFVIKPPFNRLKNKNSTSIQKQLLILICFSWQDKRKKKGPKRNSHWQMELINTKKKQVLLLKCDRLWTFPLLHHNLAIIFSLKLSNQNVRQIKFWTKMFILQASGTKKEIWNKPWRQKWEKKRR